MKLAYTEYYPRGCEGSSLPPIILLHGFCLSKESWIHAGPMLAERTGRKAYALDFRGHGESDPGDHICIMKCVEDVEEFIDDHHIDKAVLVGNYHGGQIAMHVALRMPARVEMIVAEELCRKLPSSATATADEELELLMEASINSVKLILPDVDEKTARLMFSLYLSSALPEEFTFKDANEQSIIWTYPLKMGDDGTWTLSFDADGVRRGLRNECGCGNAYPNKIYPGPAGFVCGLNMESLPTVYQELIKRHFPNSSIIRTPKFFYLLHVFYRKDFVELVSNFINSNSPLKIKSKF